jgi:hypothetical protein
MMPPRSPHEHPHSERAAAAEQIAIEMSRLARIADGQRFALWHT